MFAGRPVLSYFAAASLFLPVIAGLFRVGPFDRSLRVLYSFFIADVLLTMFSIILGFRGITNLWLIQVDTVLRSAVLLGLYAAWEETLSIKNRIIGLWIAFFLFWLTVTIIGRTFLQDDSITRSTCKVVLALTSAYLLLRVGTTQERSMLESSRFWVLLGTVTYCGGTALLSALGTSLVKSRELFTLVWPINWLVAIAANIFYSRALLCKSLT